MEWNYREFLVMALCESRERRELYGSLRVDPKATFPLYGDSCLWTMLHVIGKKPSDAMVTHAQLLKTIDDGIECIEREIWAIDNPEEQARIQKERRILVDAKESLWVVRSLSNPRKVVERMLTLLPE